MSLGNGLIHPGGLGVHTGSTTCGTQAGTAHTPRTGGILLLLLQHLFLHHALDDAAGHVDGVLGIGREGDDPLRAAGGHLELLLDLDLAPAPALHGQYGLATSADDESDDAVGDANLFLDEGGGARGRTVVSRRGTAAEAQEGGDGLGGVSRRRRGGGCGSGRRAVLSIHTGGGHGTLEPTELTGLWVGKVVWPCV